MLDRKILRASLCLFLSAVSMLAVGGCSGEKELPPPAAPVVVAPPPPPVVEEVKEKAVYVYSGDRFRDPFQSAGASTNYQAESIFDPARSSVKAIIFSPRMKSAVISVSGNGVYFVKDGKIFDVMGKTVKGFSAKVLMDRVIIMGEADNVFELKIKNDEEAKSL